MTVTGKDLIDLGFPQVRALGAALQHVRAQGLQGEALRAYVVANRPAPCLPLQDNPAAFALNIEAEDETESANVAAVTATMEALMRTPTVRAGAVMPDASGVQIVPLNMAEPVLLIRGQTTGRNLSRSAHKRGLGDHDETAVFAREKAMVAA